MRGVNPVLKKTHAVLDKEAYRYLRNTLNEVLNGIWLSVELEQRVGSLRAPMEALLQETKQNGPRHAFSAEQARLLIESCGVCEIELGSEFEIRLGYSRAEAGLVIAELHRIANKAVQPSHASAS